MRLRARGQGGKEGVGALTAAPTAAGRTGAQCIARCAFAGRRKADMGNMVRARTVFLIIIFFSKPKGVNSARRPNDHRV